MHVHIELYTEYECKLECLLNNSHLAIFSVTDAVVADKHT